MRPNCSATRRSGSTAHLPALSHPSPVSATRTSAATSNQGKPCSISGAGPASTRLSPRGVSAQPAGSWARSEEHTSELQSRLHLVCRLLLEKKKKKHINKKSIKKFREYKIDILGRIERE